MYCVSEIYSTEIWIPWLGVACADVRRCHTPVLVQLARAPCLGEQLEIPFVSEQTMHPSCTLMTKSSHPGARLEEVFARGQRIGGGKKVQRIGTACRKCTTSCSQLALEIDFSTMIPLMNFIHLIQSPNSFIQDNPETWSLGSNSLQSYTLRKTGFRLPLSFWERRLTKQKRIWNICSYDPFKGPAWNSLCHEGRGDFVEKRRILGRTARS